MTNIFRKVNVLRTEWDIPNYYENVVYNRRSHFGIFCTAVDNRNKQKVEMKRWSISGNEISKKALIELKMLKCLNHKNIISHSNSFYKDNKLYIVMDVMEENLNNIIRAQRLLSDDIRFIIFQIVSALHYLHRCGIQHGDLKPNDIGINKDMTIKIVDLNAEKPEEQNCVLTKWYMAPEIIFAWKKSDAKSDLWSLGCIMAEFLCGRIIFAGRDHLQQLRLILELLGTPTKKFFTPSCHFCIITQNLMTGEKFVRQLPYFSKKSFRKVFDECNDEDTIKFIEQLLVLEPSDRMDTNKALEHPYLQKYQKCEIKDSVVKFEEMLNFDETNLIETIKQTVEILE